MQGLAWAKGEHLPLSIMASPIFVFAFSGSVSRLIAPTWGRPVRRACNDTRNTRSSVRAWRPYSFKAGFKKRGLETVRDANLHALAALHAPFQEFLFLKAIPADEGGPGSLRLRS